MRKYLFHLKHCEFTIVRFRFFSVILFSRINERLVKASAFVALIMFSVRLPGRSHVPAYIRFGIPFHILMRAPTKVCTLLSDKSSKSGHIAKAPGSRQRYLEPCPRK